MENRSLLLFGTTFKAIGIAFALWYVVNGHLPADYLINPEVLNALYDKLYELNMDLTLRMAKAGVDMITVTGDVAMQDRIVMGPEAWREFDKPRLAKLIQACRDVNPDLFFYIHSLRL